MNTVVQMTGGVCSITPNFPAPLAGFGRGSPFARISSPLEANVLLFTQGSTKFLIVQLDVLSVGFTFREKLLHNLTGLLRDEELFVVASHTHFAPALDPNLPELGEHDRQYAENVLKSVTALCMSIMLDVHLTGCEASYAKAAASHSINRRKQGFAPRFGFPPFKRSVLRLPNAEGPKDDNIKVLVFNSIQEQKALGVIISYPCHPVGNPDPDAVSADYPGVLRGRARAMLGDGIPVVFLPGFSGNIRPNSVTKFPKSPIQMLHRLINGSVFKQFSVPDWKLWMQGLSDVFASAVHGEQKHIHFGPLEAGRVTIPFSSLMEEVDARSISFQALSFGSDLLVLGISAEVVIEYQKILSEHMGRWSNILTTGYIDGVAAYLPIDTMLDGGGLEVLSPGYSLENGRFKIGLSQIVSCQVKDLLKNLRV